MGILNGLSFSSTVSSLMGSWFLIIIDLLFGFGLGLSLKLERSWKILCGLWVMVTT